MTLKATVINRLLTKECEAFSDVSIFDVHIENGSFSNAPSGILCVFISVSKSSVFTAVQ